jgi:hypothetical protein
VEVFMNAAGAVKADAAAAQATKIEILSIELVLV